MDKLPEDFKKKWIAALRSGEYKQGQTCLYSPDANSYCCLGVAGVLCGVATNQMAYKSQFGTYMPHEDDLIAPPLGMPGLLSHDDLYDTAHHLARMNDNGKSFSEIADYIEANL